MIPDKTKIVRPHVASPDWKPNTKYLYTVATTNGWNHEQVKELIKTHFNLDSTKNLSYDQYNDVLEWLDRLPAGTMTTERDPNTIDMFEP